MTKQQLQAIMPTATPELIDRYYQPILDKTSAAEINTPLRLAHFLTQIGHETGDMHAVSENLNYSSAGLISTWPTLFNVTNAGNYAHKPELIANRAYGGRYGNGPEVSGDGWKYRGRGFIQTTFKGNYLAFEKATGIAVVLNPDVVATNPDICVMTATYFWTSHGLNAIADRDDLKSLRHIVNGGLIGLDDCARRLAVAKQVLGIV